jgi:hypothetical protein
VYYTVGWAITDADESAIAALPGHAWDAGWTKTARPTPRSAWPS